MSKGSNESNAGDFALKSSPAHHANRLAGHPAYRLKFRAAALLPATLKLKASVPVVFMLPPSFWLSLERTKVNEPLAMV